MGSAESVASLNASRAVRHQVAAGKLDLTLIPENMTTGGQEEISVFLTTLWIYETVLKPAEWLLVWQTDSLSSSPCFFFFFPFVAPFFGWQSSEKKNPPLTLSKKPRHSVRQLARQPQ